MTQFPRLGEHEIPIVGEVNRTIRCRIWYNWRRRTRVRLRADPPEGFPVIFSGSFQVPT
jgi:hypothetical protein